MSGRIKSGRRGSRYVALAAALVCVIGGLAPRALGHAGDLTRVSTLEHRLVGKNDPDDSFALLKTVEGEPYFRREDLIEGQSGRKDRRKSLIYFGQITDFQLADEESPAREERFDGDPFGRASTSGYRPQEPLTIHQVELSIRQLDHFLHSPVRQGNGERAKLANTVMTGDLADNMQFNETVWVRKLLEGGRIDPNTGTLKLEGTKCEGLPASALDDPKNYTGVADYDDYANDNPIYYDPEKLLGVYLDRNWPTYPKLFDAAQKPFDARGIEVPSYVAFGNHDGLYQGTVAVFPGLFTPGDPTFEDVALDCLKPVYPLTIADAPNVVTGPDQLQSILTSDPDKVMQVPPDPKRRFVNQSQFKDIFRDGKQKDDHGFKFIDKDEKQASNDAASYYSFSPKPGIRYIVLDTLAAAGVLVIPTTGAELSSGAEGNIDHPQWQWLQGELDKAERKGELVIAFGHHAVGSLNVELADEVSPCIGPDQHGHDRNVSCGEQDPRDSSPVHLGPELRDLFLEHPNVVAYVAGHSHENEITPFPDSGGDGGGFWEIKSPSTVDWPPQLRVIELMDNKDGTLSIFATVLDHAANVEIPKSGTNAKNLGIVNLAAIGRVLSFNDPQVGPGGGNEGEHKDRNVELLIADPRAGATAQPESLGDDLPASGEDELPSDEEVPVEPPVEPPLGGPLPTELLP